MILVLSYNSRKEKWYKGESKIKGVYKIADKIIESFSCIAFVRRW